MWSAARLTAYVTTALTGLGALMSFWGYATFDPVTGMIDPAPFSIYTAAPLIAAPLASAMAAVALWRGWGQK